MERTGGRGSEKLFPLAPFAVKLYLFLRVPGGLAVKLRWFLPGQAPLAVRFFYFAEASPPAAGDSGSSTS